MANTYLDQDLVIEATSDYFEIVEDINFASTYYVASITICGPDVVGDRTR